MSVVDLLGLGADVPWPDAGATVAAQQWGGRAGVGRLADAVAWLAGANAAFPPPRPAAVRWVHLGAPTTVEAPEGVHTDVVDAGDGLDAGAAAADRLVDSGTDLLLVSGRGTDAGALAVSIIAGVEPVAVLPRGAAALDTTAWIARLTAVRDRRRALMPLRERVDELLDALGDPLLATATGLIAQAASRRTPIVLDGPLPVAAALVAHRVQPRFAAWWRAADTSPDPVQRRAVDVFDQQPLADNGIATADGTAALLALALLRAGADRAARADDPTDEDATDEDATDEDATGATPTGRHAAPEPAPEPTDRPRPRPATLLEADR
ncbi:MAG: nicotinate-nucleotide--dimethylbenzimidazole phosphoribosyltransferase [Jatrophihabitans sp.]|uniref:nicotinate-nucleotide--dimethylbenzimidazole phosphoribosyltransferase n=1 Tax=Jatrophihabitans sp. TaxID=1932789 RepID=UPI003F7D3AD3